MTPAARLAAALEIIADIEAAISKRGQPADRIVSAYFRTRRYAGSKDRREASAWVYSILRNRGVLVWLLQQVEAPLEARNLLLAHLAQLGDEGQGALELFDDETAHGPDALTADEKQLFEKLSSIDADTAPIVAKLSVPEWAEDGLKRRFGDDFAKAVEQLNGAAPLDIRVNKIKGDAIPNQLRDSFEPIAGLENGFRNQEHVRVDQSDGYKYGRIEIQDAAAQMASVLVGAQPKEQVLDLCAGAGGKSLAIAADMENRGQVHAFDISEKRTRELKRRFTRAGVRNIQPRLLPKDPAKRAKMLAEHKGKMHRVVLDVPCSGVGTWRRNPDQRWRLDDESLKEYQTRQAELLAEGADLARDGGYVFYMTCSLLPAENEEIVDQFLADNTGFERVDLHSRFKETGMKGADTDSLALNEFDVCLAPHSNDTDGFYIACLKRLSEAS